MVDPITIGVGVAALGSAVVGAVRRRRRLSEEVDKLAVKSAVDARNDVRRDVPAETTKAPASIAPPVAPPVTIAEQKTAHNLIVAPAYPNLVAASVEIRQALVDVANELGIEPGALATVIQSESEWKTFVPEKEKGTPRAGYIQITKEANLPGFNSPEKVWAVRGWNGVDQLRKIVLPYFSRMKLDRVRTGKEPALELYKLTFLPGDRSKPDDYPLGKKGSKELLHPKYKITRGDVYTSNPVFHGNGARSIITWNDVRNKIKHTEAVAEGKYVTLGGQIVDGPPPAKSPLETKSETRTIEVPAPVGKPGPTFAEGASCSVASSLRKLLREVDAVWPNRKRQSDGLCGDAAHKARQSDHNDGNALDITLDGNNGPNLDALAELLLRDARTKYVIWNERIATRNVDGGKWRPYPIDPANKGKVNPHTRHLHLSIHANAREDGRPWKIDQLRTTTPPLGDDTDKLLLDPVGAWKAGKVDNFQWVPLSVGDFRLEVAADCLAVNGVRLPVSFVNVIALCQAQDMVPNTKAICDARWMQGEKKIVLRTRPPNNRGPDSVLVRETKEWSAKIGPFSRTLVMGPWKEWVLDDVRHPGNATNYGLWGPNGLPIQTLGHRHDHNHVDDTQYFAPVRRNASYKGQRVDLLEEFAKGSLLGAPLPKWLTEKLR
jgi:hypothetical protein